MKTMVFTIGKKMILRKGRRPFPLNPTDVTLMPYAAEYVKVLSPSGDDPILVATTLYVGHRADSTNQNPNFMLIDIGVCGREKKSSSIALSN